jgi:PAS domain S-box-containing protein
MTKQLLATRPQKRFWVTAFAAATALIAVIGFIRYRSEEKHIAQKQAQNLTTVGTLKASQIAVWRKEKLADVNRFAQGPALVSSIDDLMQAPSDPEHQKKIRFMLDLNRKGDLYQNVLIVSPEGKTLFAAVEPPEILSQPTRDALKKALLTRAPAFSNMYRHDQDKVVVDAVAPVCAQNGQALAVLILRTDAASHLYPLIKFWPTDNATAETLLVRREDDEIVFLNEVRHNNSTALELRMPLTRKELPSVQAALGYRGICSGKDYRGVDVLADVQPIPDSDWFIVTKIDQSEIRAEMRYHALTILEFAGLGIFLAAALTAVGYRRRQSHLYRDLYQIEHERRETQEKFETILYSIGDAVMVTDDQARVRQMNPVAEHLTGWKEGEAIGKPVKDIFNIVNQETRQAAENPVLHVLRDGKIVGLANHTMLIARDGTERPIADSGAPVRDNHGNVTGVVLVFRDQSADYTAQKTILESEAQYRDLFDNMAEAFALHEIICDRQGTPVDYRFLKVNPAFERLTGLCATQIIGHRVLEILPGTEPHWIETYGAVAKDGMPRHFENISSALGRSFRVTAFRPRPGQFCTIFEDITDAIKNEEERKTLENQLQQSQRLEAVGRLAGGVAHDFNNMLAVIIGNTELARARLESSNPLCVELQEVITASKRSADLVRQLLAFASKQTIMPRELNLNDTITVMLNMLNKLIHANVVLEWKPDPELWNVKMDMSQIDQILVNLTVNARDAITGAGKVVFQTSNVSATSEGAEFPSELPAGDFVLLRVTDTGCGMDAETQAHIFEPFFTTKQRGVGTGLGLSTVYGIVRQNGGFIRIASKPDEGSRFDIYLPRFTADTGTVISPSSPPPAAPPVSASITPETILLVEDEPALLSLSESLLKKAGYTVLAAGSPKDAIKVSDSYAGEIHLLLTDVVMPDMSGYELWQQLIVRRPGLKSLYVSGYTADMIAQREVIEGTISFLQKPFTSEALVAKLHAILSTPTPKQEI